VSFLKHCQARLLYLLFCLFLCGSLTACQFSLPQSPKISPKTDEPIHLTFWHGVNPPANRDVLQTLVDRFNQSHPNLHVDPIYVGQADQQLPKLFAAAVGNALPDLLWYAPMLTGQLVELDVLKPLDDWLPTIPEAQDLDPALRESMELEGKTWSIPFDTNNVGIFYRPSLFKAAGITQLPATWDEFRTVAKTLTRDTNQDGKIDQRGMLLPLGKGEWSVFTWLPFLWSAGGELQATVNLEQPGAIAALNFWKDLLTAGSAVLSQPERGYEMTGFINGKVAMQISGPWTLGELQKSGVDFAVMPIPKQERRATSIGGENLFVFKSTTVREAAALEFARAVISEDFQTTWGIQTGYLPVNLKSRDSAAYRAFRKTQPVVDTFLTQAKDGRSRPIFPGYNRISDAIGRAVEGVLLDRVSPETALRDAQKRLDLIFGNLSSNTSAIAQTLPLPTPSPPEH
jgi:multiple sugar transport system substrate-binding protein